MGRKNLFLIVSILLIVCSNLSVSAQSDRAENLAKFSFNIIRFIDWSFVNGNTLTVNTFADDENFAEALEKFLMNQTIQNKTIAIVPINSVAEAHGEVIFVGKSGLAQISMLTKKKILVIAVGESSGKSGADISLYENGGDMHYHVNVNSLNQKGFKYQTELITFAD